MSKGKKNRLQLRGQAVYNGLGIIVIVLALLCFITVINLLKEKNKLWLVIGVFSLTILIAISVFLSLNGNR